MRFPVPPSIPVPVSCIRTFMLKNRLDAWRSTSSIPQERVDALNKHHEEFLLRFHSLLSSTNKPGRVESREAQRRIAFFVNSMFMRQPQVMQAE